MTRSHAQGGAYWRHDSTFSRGMLYKQSRRSINEKTKRHEDKESLPGTTRRIAPETINEFIKNFAGK